MKSAPAIRAFADNFAYEPTTRLERMSALGLAAVLIAGSVGVAAVARIRLAPVPSFVLLIESIAMIALMLTHSMLYAQYRARRYAPLGILSFAFAMSGMFHAIYALSFPGIFTPGGLLWSGPQSAAWAAIFGRFYCNVLILLFVAAEWREQRGIGWGRRTVVAIGGWSTAVFALTTLVVTAGHPLLPKLIEPSGTFTLLSLRVVQPVMMLMPLVAGVALIAVCGLKTRLSTWLAVTLLTFFIELCTAGVLSNARYSLGWYVARIDLAMSSLLFIVAMQLQLAGVLQRAANASERQHNLFEIVSGAPENAREAIEVLLARVRVDLDFEWGFFARVQDGTATVETSTGVSPFANDSRTRIESGLLHAVTGRELFVLEDGSTALGDESRSLWAAFMSVPVFVEGRLYGSAGFASRRRRRVPLTEADRDFMLVLGILLGAAIERDQRSKHLAGLAFFDSLTSLPNRTNLMTRLRERIAQGERYGSPFAVHFLDLDKFKAINDRYGHGVGDQILQGFADRLRLTVRDSDVVARLGGDEFVVLQHLENDLEESTRLAARITDLQNSKLSTAAGQLEIGVSVGTACYPRDAREASELLNAADEAQYRVKRRRSMTLAGIRSSAGRGMPTAG